MQLKTKDVDPCTNCGQIPCHTLPWDTLYPYVPDGSTPWKDCLSEEENDAA